MRQYEVTTLQVTAWHVEESDYTCLPDTWRGQFHTEDTYVVRWKYKVALTGRALQMMGGGASKHKARINGKNYVQYVSLLMNSFERAI